MKVGSKPENGKIIYSVSDNGAGFDMQYAGKLFCEFQRLHTDKEFEGTGIGIALARRIVECHNGKTWALSEPGKGTTFFFSLPAKLPKYNKFYGISYSEKFCIPQNTEIQQNTHWSDYCYIVYCKLKHKTWLC